MASFVIHTAASLTERTCSREYFRHSGALERQARLRTLQWWAEAREDHMARITRLLRARPPRLREYSYQFETPPYGSTALDYSRRQGRTVYLERGFMRYRFWN